MSDPSSRSPMGAGAIYERGVEGRGEQKQMGALALESFCDQISLLSHIYGRMVRCVALREMKRWLAEQHSAGEPTQSV